MADFPYLILIGAFAGGLVSGLTGFGTGITALPFWLAATTPQLAAPLVVVCSLVAQVQTLPAIWHAIDFNLNRLTVFGISLVKQRFNQVVFGIVRHSSLQMHVAILGLLNALFTN